MESHQYIKTVFSQTIGPIELKFHVNTSYDKLAKTDAKYFGHMTKMATPPRYGKNPLKIFSRTRRPMTLGCSIGDVGSTKFEPKKCKEKIEAFPFLHQILHYQA